METNRSESAAIAVQFNDAINRRDGDGLARLMTDDHVFIDTAGQATRGKAAYVEGWQGFFEQFPDYQNVFERVLDRDDLAVMIGHSTCSFALLAGPALWTARIRGDQVAEWRVYDDTPEQRVALEIG